MGDQQQGPQHLFSKPGRVYARYVEAALFASLPLRRVSETEGVERIWKKESVGTVDGRIMRR